MQAVLTPSIGQMKDCKEQLGLLFDELNGADNMQKNRIENEIISYGADAIDYLIDKLTTSRGVQRGVAAMSLIRIGSEAVFALRQLREANKNFAWVANYIIQEIEGTI